MVPSGILPPAAATNDGLPVVIDRPAYTVPSGILVPISGMASLVCRDPVPGAAPAGIVTQADSQPAAASAITTDIPENPFMRCSPSSLRDAPDDLAGVIDEYYGRGSGRGDRQFKPRVPLRVP